MKKWDVLLCLFCIGAGLLLHFGLPKQAGDTVVVRENGVVLMQLPLGEDAVVPLAHHTLVIEGGTARFTAADCKNALCRAAVLTEAGGSLVCLPRRVLVTVQSAAVDTMSY